jgi:P4 family phage/plasmid primase-like protien
MDNDSGKAYNEFKQKYFTQKAKNEINNELMSLILNLNQFEVSKYYYEAHKEKYIFGGDVKNKKSGWWGFKPNNIIINYGAIPTGLLNNLSSFMQTKIIEQQTILTFKLLETKENKKLSQDDKEEECKKIKAWLDACKKAYMKLGSSSFINGCIDYLNQLYFNDEIDSLVDAKHYLLAFSNGVYDYLADEFRAIKPTDYISKSCNYNYNQNSNGKIREKINGLLLSIFGNEEVKEYFLGIHGLSLFTNKLESLYLLNGKGSNGKGLLTSIIHGALGDYYLQAESTFLTSKHEAGKANSTLANAKGCRYLSVSEPEDTSLESTFNMGLIKTLTGRDIISTRALYKDNIQYIPQFSPFIQCNQIPKLNSVGNAEKRRFKIINFPFQFDDNPTKPNEKLINRELKDTINNEFYNEFMLMMIEKAIQYKNKQLTIPNDVIQHTNEYLEDNNILLGWFSTYIIQTNNNKDYVKVTDLFNNYKKTTNESIDNKLFLKNLKTFDIDISLLRGIKIARGIQLKIDDEEEINDLDI